jgi:hypothetical protein
MISNFEKPIKFITGMSEQDAENNTDTTLILNDYIKIFEDFTEHNNLSDKFKGKLDTYMGNFSKSLKELLNDYKSKRDINIANELLKRVLSLCLTFFPEIFLNVLPKSGKVLNAIPFVLYQEPKVTEPDKGIVLNSVPSVLYQEPKVTGSVKGDIKPKEVLEDVVERKEVVLEDVVERTNIVSNILNIVSYIFNYLKLKNEIFSIIEGNYSLYSKEDSLFWKYETNVYKIKSQIRGYKDVISIHINHRNHVISLLQKANQQANGEIKVGLMGRIFRNNMVAPKPVDNQTLKNGGKKNTTDYKLNGDKVFLIHNNRKIKRCIYIKGNGKTKYCKINKVFISLSKLKNKIIE